MSVHDRAVPPLHSHEGIEKCGSWFLGMLGEELRKARGRAGLTQEELSFRAGLDRTCIPMLQHDKKSPTLEVLFRLCDALGVPASRMIARVERERKAKK